MPDNGKPSIIEQVDTRCQLLFLKHDKKTRLNKVALNQEGAGGDTFNKNSLTPQQQTRPELSNN